MSMKAFVSIHWQYMTPEFIIAGTILLLAVLDLFIRRKNWLIWIGLAGTAAAAVSLAILFGAKSVSILYDTFVLDEFAKMFKLILLSGTFLVLIMLFQEREKDIQAKGEYIYLLLTALLGGMMVSSSRDLITLFAGLELLSIASYILAGMKKKNLKSNEAAMKYLINGGIASAITLFGMSYLYGLTGTTSLTEMFQVLKTLENPQMLYLIGISFFLLFTGLAFKIASVPFHMWAPDVYEGAPVPAAAFFSTVSKTAGFILILRIFLTVYTFLPQGKEVPYLLSMQGILSAVAAAAMIIGNVTALKQKNVKRMLAYSSIAHAGYVLTAFVSFSHHFYFESIWFYLLSYLFMNVGAFCILHIVEKNSGDLSLSSFSGLYRRSPAAAVCMALFLLSLAGIPGTAGFIAKLGILMSAFSSDVPMIMLASIMVAATVISYVYYFGVFTQMFFKPSGENRMVKIGASSMTVLVLCGVLVIVLGLFPNAGLSLFYLIK
ncbi:NADH-quinone oxidoreductase subunit N [Metabacillus sp. GX 13764]|uniref:NADH-quinone oxidoreductase subunit N n=1 Tax=Metabacillus kandeliae TaxID=2900151 RepID=UPI001E512AA4|nr:NADH-quinone oxidoreductase subunit N [Metabacillus kandeliae]MCD7034647.1 NADH-quinone oxidoreductase subunit N [Metabacillus kandeliae]